jgi:hypothetical protein
MLPSWTSSFLCSLRGLSFIPDWMSLLLRLPLNLSNARDDNQKVYWGRRSSTAGNTISGERETWVNDVSNNEVPPERKEKDNSREYRQSKETITSRGETTTQEVHQQQNRRTKKSRKRLRRERDIDLHWMTSLFPCLFLKLQTQKGGDRKRYEEKDKW